MLRNNMTVYEKTNIYGLREVQNVLPLSLTVLIQSTRGGMKRPINLGNSAPELINK